MFQVLLLFPEAFAQFHIYVLFVLILCTMRILVLETAKFWFIVL